MLIFIYGQDDYRITEKVKSIKDRFIKTVDPKILSIYELEGDNIEYHKLQEKINSSSLFTKKNLIIIYNFFANKNTDIFDKAMALLKKHKNQDANVLCFVEKNLSPTKLNAKQKKLFSFLSQEKYCQEFKILTNYQLEKYALELFKQKSQKISKPALNLLILKTGPNLWKLNNEVRILINLKKEEIDISDIENLASQESENNIFKLCDSMANLNHSLSFSLLNEEIEKKTSLEYILSMLIRQFKILVELKSDNNRSSAKEIGLHPWVFQKTKQQIQKFEMKQLLTLLDKLVNIEYAYKKGKVDLKKSLLSLM